MNKKHILYPIALVFLLITLYGAIAAITFNDPSTTGATINDTYTLNITTTLNNVLNCTFATTSDGVFATTLNSSASQTVFTNSTDTTALTEVEDTTLTIYCYNSTANQSGTLTINIDNTAPVCSYTYDSGVPVLKYNDLLGLSIIQSSTDTTDLTYSWILYDPEGNSQTTSTSAEPTEFQDPTVWDDFGEFILALTLTDEASKSTNCNNVTFTVTSKDSDADVVVQTINQTKLKGRDLFIMFGLLVIILIAVASFFIVGVTKKSKRR